MSLRMRHVQPSRMPQPCYRCGDEPATSKKMSEECGQDFRQQLSAWAVLRADCKLECRDPCTWTRAARACFCSSPLASS
eukprot:6189576-Pleurochrysis_carterae.AAC.5